MAYRILQKDVFSGVSLLFLSIVLWVLSDSFPELDGGYPGPALFPRIIGVCLGIMGVLLLIQSVRSRKSKPVQRLTRSVDGLTRLAVALGIVSSYPLLVTHVHFIPIMGGLILIFGLLLKNKPWQAMLTATLSALLIYALFTQLLGVPL